MLNSYDSKYIIAYKKDKSIYLVNTKLFGIKDKKSIYKNESEYIISDYENCEEIGTIISEFKTY